VIEPTQPPSRDVRVLVVDDHRAFRMAAGAVLRRTPGFALAAEAESGEEALELVASVRPDLVLLDVRLPAMDGVEASHAIARDAPGTVVFLLSTYGRADLPAAVRDAPVAAYLHKEELTPERLRQLWSAR
jgi:DNA-binding NarL/FixJ family response regulator